MFDLLQLLGWPPSLLTGGLLILLSLVYGIQARIKLRPILLAVQVALIIIIFDAFINATDIWPADLAGALLTQTVGKLLGYFIISWLIIRVCFILRFRNSQSNIFTRNRRP